jgi:hypothetical protein
VTLFYSSYELFLSTYYSHLEVILVSSHASADEQLEPIASA